MAYNKRQEVLMLVPCKETEPVPSLHFASASLFLPLIVVVSEPLTGIPFAEPEVVHLQEYSLVQDPKNISNADKKNKFFIGFKFTQY